MRMKIRMPLAVLRGDAMPHTIRENRLEGIEFRTCHVRMLIHHNPCQVLPNSAAHHPCLAQLNQESLR